MNKKCYVGDCIKYLLFILINIFSWMNISYALNNHELRCPQVNEAKKQLELWIHTALKGDGSIGCPTSSVNMSINKLETISRTEGDCKDEAVGILVAFFTIFNGQPDYKMCGFEQKEDALLAHLAVDGKVCVKKTSANDTEKCFNELMARISRLKNRGALTEAFILAKKTADSNDPSGLTQLILGLMYEYGEGTDKNTALAILWLKKALEKISDKQLRITTISALSVTHEEIHDYKNAEKYAQQCAVMNDPYCKKGLDRLRKRG